MGDHPSQSFPPWAETRLWELRATLGDKTAGRGPGSGFPVARGLNSTEGIPDLLPALTAGSEGDYFGYTLRCGSRLLIARSLGIARGVRSWSWASGGRGRNAQGRRRVSVSRKGGGLRELQRLRAYGRGLPVHTGVRGAGHREWEAPEHARQVLPAEAHCILGNLAAPCALGVRGAGAHAAAQVRRCACRSLTCVRGAVPGPCVHLPSSPKPFARPPLRSPAPDFFHLGGRDQSDRFVSLKYWGPHGAGGRERDVVQVGGGMCGRN